jgi:hypothetical protein
MRIKAASLGRPYVRPLPIILYSLRETRYIQGYSREGYFWISFYRNNILISNFENNYNWIHDGS